MIKKVLVLSVVFIFGLYYLPILLAEQAVPSVAFQEEASNELLVRQEVGVLPLPVTGFEHYIGKEINQFSERYGEPDRVAPAELDGDWWIYDQQEAYAQIEVRNQKIASIFVLGNRVNTGVFRTGMNREHILDETELAKYFQSERSGQPFSLHLSNLDWQMFPLIQFENDSFLMFFIHPNNDEVYALRYLSYESLMELNMYTIFTEDGEKLVTKTDSYKQEEFVMEEKEKQLQRFVNLFRQKNSVQELTFSEELQQAADEIAKEFHGYQLTFEEEKAVFEKYNFVTKSIYHIGNQVYDMPTQFGLLLSNEFNQEILLDENYQYIGIKSIEDDTLLLLK